MHPDVRPTSTYINLTTIQMTSSHKKVYLTKHINNQFTERHSFPIFFLFEEGAQFFLDRWGRNLPLFMEERKFSFLFVKDGVQFACFLFLLIGSSFHFPFSPPFFFSLFFCFPFLLCLGPLFEEEKREGNFHRVLLATCMSFCEA